MDDHIRESTETVSEVDSINRRAEDIAMGEKEAGREDTGSQGDTNRPTGTSTARDFTSVDPKEPMDEGSPAG